MLAPPRYRGGRGRRAEKFGGCRHIDDCGASHTESRAPLTAVFKATIDMFTLVSLDPGESEIMVMVDDTLDLVLRVGT